MVRNLFIDTMWEDGYIDGGMARPVSYVNLTEDNVYIIEKNLSGKYDMTILPIDGATDEQIRSEIIINVLESSLDIVVEVIDWLRVWELTIRNDLIQRGVLKGNLWT